MTGARLKAAAAELARTGLMYFVDRAGEIHPVTLDEYVAIPTEDLRGCAMFVQRTSAEAWAAGIKTAKALAVRS